MDVTRAPGPVALSSPPPSAGKHRGKKQQNVFPEREERWKKPILPLQNHRRWPFCRGSKTSPRGSVCQLKQDRLSSPLRGPPRVRARPAPGFLRARCSWSTLNKREQQSHSYCKRAGLLLSAGRRQSKQKQPHLKHNCSFLFAPFRQGRVHVHDPEPWC